MYCWIWLELRNIQYHDLSWEGRYSVVVLDGHEENIVSNWLILLQKADHSCDRSGKIQNWYTATLICVQDCHRTLRIPRDVWIHHFDVTWFLDNVVVHVFVRHSVRQSSSSIPYLWDGKWILFFAGLVLFEMSEMRKCLKTLCNIVSVQLFTYISRDQAVQVIKIKMIKIFRHVKEKGTDTFEKWRKHGRESISKRERHEDHENDIDEKSWMSYIEFITYRHRKKDLLSCQTRMIRRTVRIDYRIASIGIPDVPDRFMEILYVFLFLNGSIQLQDAL